MLAYVSIQDCLCAHQGIKLHVFCCAFLYSSEHLYVLGH